MTSTRPIFMATHPRACSTAFERVFMTRRDTLACVHEPFGDAFYYGPERLSKRFDNDEAARVKSGFAETTYKDVLDQIHGRGSEGKRIFIKDIAHYLVPPNGAPASPAPSLRDPYAKGSAHPGTHANGNGAANGGTAAAAAAEEEGLDTAAIQNPTVIPKELLRQFHFTFLIRHPSRAIPSYYRCTIPPLADITGFHEFMPSEAGYDELRRLFDYLRAEGIVGSATTTTATNGHTTNGHHTNGQTNGHGNDNGVNITVIDADDMLAKPEETIRAYCRDVGLDFDPDMLRWDDEENQRNATRAFEKWIGFHEDAIHSSRLKARTHAAKILTREDEDEQWREKYGPEAQRVIRQTVDENLHHYEHLKAFAVKV